MTENWAIIEGFVLPLVISIILRENWGEGTKAVGAFLVCAAFAVGSTYVAGQLDLGNPDFPKLLGNILTVLVVALASYKGLWKPTGVAGAISEKTG